MVTLQLHSSYFKLSDASRFKYVDHCLEQHSVNNLMYEITIFIIMIVKFLFPKCKWLSVILPVVKVARYIFSSSEIHLKNVQCLYL